MPSTASDRHVVLGRVNGLFGVKGWVKVYSYTRPSEAILGYERWWIGRPGDRRPFFVLDGRIQGKTLVARLADADNQPLPDRDAAIGLLESEIAVDSEQMPALPDGEYYWFELVGLSVVTLEGVALGQIQAMMETGANDVLVVKGERERLIPFLMGQVIHKVDFDAGMLTVDWDPDF